MEDIAQRQDSPKAFVQRLFTQVMERVNVPLSMRGSVSLLGERLHLGEHSYDLRLFRRVLLVSIGKASVPMAQHVIETIGALLPLSGIVVGSGTWAAPDGIRYMQGDHPVPYKNSFEAARASLELMRAADEETLVIYLISGGASSMVETPLDSSISLDDLSTFYERILHSGLSIDKANILRKHFSAIKGGRLALAAGSATRCTLLISDVPIGRLNAVGSGPSLADSSTVEECRQLLMETPALAKVPESIKEFAMRMPETPKHLPEGRAPSVCLSLLSSDSLIEAVKPLVAAAGYRVVVDNSCDDWNYSEAARYLVDRSIAESMKGGPVCILSAGEVTVSIEGKAGIGGRNQQWALEVARLIDGEQGYVAMSVGSDGVDGNSMAAGAVVDATTWRRAHAAGFHPELSLAAFDAYPVFAALGDAITPGPSENNIRDLRVILANGKSQDNAKQQDSEQRPPL
jgi:hydroxypyruvate reductase